MNETLEKFFEKWASSANWQITHPLDENRFMDFIIQTAETREQPLEFEKFKDLCLPYHKDEDRILHYFTRYEFSVDLLKRFKAK